MRSEAHLPPDRRRLSIVRVIPRPRRSWRGWLILIAVIALNEARGLGVVAVVIRAWPH